MASVLLETVDVQDSKTSTKGDHTPHKTPRELQNTDTKQMDNGKLPNLSSSSPEAQPETCDVGTIARLRIGGNVVPVAPDHCAEHTAAHGEAEAHGISKKEANHSNSYSNHQKTKSDDTSTDAHQPDMHHTDLRPATVLPSPGNHQMVSPIMYVNPQQAYQSPMAYSYTPVPTFAFQATEIPYTGSVAQQQSMPTVQQQNMNSQPAVLAPFQTCPAMIPGTSSFPISLMYSCPVWNISDISDGNSQGMSETIFGARHMKGIDGRYVAMNNLVNLKSYDGDMRNRFHKRIGDGQKNNRKNSLSSFFGDEVNDEFRLAQQEALQISRNKDDKPRSKVLNYYKNSLLKAKTDSENGGNVRDGVDSTEWNGTIPKDSSFSYMDNMAGKSTYGSRPRSFSSTSSTMKDAGASIDDPAELPSFSTMRNNLAAFAVDHDGVNALQKVICMASPTELTLIIQELSPRLRDLSVDAYGNYIVQALLKSSKDERMTLLITGSAVYGRVLPLSLHIYGCRVIQAALDVLPYEAKLKIADEIAPHTLGCAADRHANHVIQKCLQAIQPTAEAVATICECISTRAYELAKDEYGCRLVQRLLQYCTIPSLVDHTIEVVTTNVEELSKDHFGNYVIQFLINEGSDQTRQSVFQSLAPIVLKLSCHPFACHVMETSFRKCSKDESFFLLNAMLNSTSHEWTYPNGTTEDGSNADADGTHKKIAAVLKMACDQYGNFVLQTALKTEASSATKEIEEILKHHCNTLRRNSYGKHVLGSL